MTAATRFEGMPDSAMRGVSRVLGTGENAVGGGGWRGRSSQEKKWRRGLACADEIGGRGISRVRTALVIEHQSPRHACEPAASR